MLLVSAFGGISGALWLPLNGDYRGRTLDSGLGDSVHHTSATISKVPSPIPNSLSMMLHIKRHLYEMSHHSQRALRRSVEMMDIVDTLFNTITPIGGTKATSIRDVPSQSALLAEICGNR